MNSFNKCQFYIAVRHEFVCSRNFIDRCTDRIVQVNQETTAYITRIKDSVVASRIDAVLFCNAISVGRYAICCCCKQILRHTCIGLRYFIDIERIALVCTCVQVFMRQIVQHRSFIFIQITASTFHA